MQLFKAMMEDVIRSIVWKVHTFISSKVAYLSICILAKRLYVCLLMPLIKLEGQASGAWMLSSLAKFSS